VLATGGCERRPADTERRAGLHGRPQGAGGRLRLTGPLLHTLQTVAPNAEFILWGAEDTAKARIHASDESVDPTEIEAMILAQVILLQELAR
jgi:hypothetical protein